MRIYWVEKPTSNDNDSKLYQFFTKGDDSKSYRILTWTVIPFVAFLSAAVIVLSLLLSYSLDIRITAFQFFDGWMMSSWIVVLIIIVFHYAFTYIIYSLSGDINALKKDRKIFQKTQRSFSIFTGLTLAIIVLITLFSSFHGFTNYRSRTHIYVHDGETEDLMVLSMDQDLIELKSVLSISKETYINDSRIRNYPNVYSFGFIVEKGSRLVLENVTFESTRYDGIILEVEGQLIARNCNFRNIFQGQSGDDRESGIKLYSYSTTPSLFENCSFTGCDGNAILSHHSALEVKRSRFQNIKNDCIRAYGGHLSIWNSEFNRCHRACTVIRGVSEIRSSSVSECKEGIYLEQSDCYVRSCNFSRIGEFGIQYFEDRPLVSNCSFYDCPNEIENLEYVQDQVVCFLLFPGGIILISLVLMVSIPVLNGIVSWISNSPSKRKPKNRTKEKKKPILEKDKKRKEICDGPLPEDIDIHEWNKNRGNRLLPTLGFLSLSITGLFFFLLFVNSIFFDLLLVSLVILIFVFLIMTFFAILNFNWPGRYTFRDDGITFMYPREIVAYHIEWEEFRRMIRISPRIIVFIPPRDFVIWDVTLKNARKRPKLLFMFNRSEVEFLKKTVLNAR